MGAPPQPAGALFRRPFLPCAARKAALAFQSSYSSLSSAVSVTEGLYTNPNARFNSSRKLRIFSAIALPIPSVCAAAHAAGSRFSYRSRPFAIYTFAAAVSLQKKSNGVKFYNFCTVLGEGGVSGKGRATEG